MWTTSCFSCILCQNGTVVLNQYVYHGNDTCRTGVKNNNSNPLQLRVQQLRIGCLPFELYGARILCLHLEHAWWSSPMITQFNQYSSTCTSQSSLCAYGSKECFSRDRICLFERNIYGDPAHCSDTEHLRYCKSHVCPDSFKCNASYCIPVHMVCDMILDCPDGEDESQCDNLTVERGMFR